MFCNPIRTHFLAETAFSSFAPISSDVIKINEVPPYAFVTKRAGSPASSQDIPEQDIPASGIQPER